MAAAARTALAAFVLAALLAPALAACDAAFLLQDHQQFDLDALAASGVRILDTRGRMAGLTVERL